jgi:hypothetical protein
MLGTRSLLRQMVSTSSKFSATAALQSNRHLSSSGSEYMKSPGVIDGKAIGKAVQADVKERVAALKQKGVIPGLAVVLVGARVDSSTYVRMKAKACEEVGISSHVYKYDESTSQAEILETGE